MPQTAKSWNYKYTVLVSWLIFFYVFSQRFYDLLFGFLYYRPKYATVTTVSEQCNIEYKIIQSGTLRFFFSIADFHRLRMTDPRPIFEYNEESQADKFARKSKDSPFMIVGKQCLM